MNTDMLNTFMRAFLCLILTLILAGCDKRITWQEEVKLNDGRVIVVAQKKRCVPVYTGANFGCLPVESWLMFTLPDFGNREIVWNEPLDPMLMNIHGGRLYVIGYPSSQAGFYAYDKPRPPYIGFVWENASWTRIPFAEIPEAIYDANMLINSLPPNGTKIITLSHKYELNSSPGFDPYSKRIDPNHKSNFN